MKELTQDHKANEITISEERQEKRTRQLIGQQRKIPGLNLFKLELKTGLVSRALVQEVNLVVTNPNKGQLKGTYKSHKVNFEEGFVYCQATNTENAVKVFKRDGFKIQ